MRLLLSKHIEQLIFHFLKEGKLNDPKYPEWMFKYICEKVESLSLLLKDYESEGAFIIEEYLRLSYDKVI